MKNREMYWSPSAKGWMKPEEKETCKTFYGRIKEYCKQYTLFRKQPYELKNFAGEIDITVSHLKSIIDGYRMPDYFRYHQIIQKLNKGIYGILDDDAKKRLAVALNKGAPDD